MPINQVKYFLTTLGVQGHEIKQTRYGTKKICDLQIIKNHLNPSKIEFYTHSLREEQTNKIVIYRLHDMETDDVLYMCLIL